MRGASGFCCCFEAAFVFGGVFSRYAGLVLSVAMVFIMLPQLTLMYLSAWRINFEGTSCEWSFNCTVLYKNILAVLNVLFLYENIHFLCVMLLYL